ncbi:hypothetical protein Ocin01_10132 [Orchesella cincta]|uniref:Uncharacterized protein n=1 Tax=Orchesella cincta TaxID=48709 RepID=A0A1D2MUH6_ORCCI|nr:hypothetical protein Ocin01_10132 [Orchesella cincta]
MQHTDATELKPSHPSIIVDEYNKLLQASKKAKQEAQEKEAMGSETLKPSVFVGKGRPYSSSLEIGYQWDRTKYNPVLLPDLTKVVYPDLDSAFTKEPSFKFQISQKKEYTIVEEEETLLPSERLPINRLTKPKLKEIIEKHKEKAKQIPDCLLQDINESNSDKTDINNQTEDDAARDNPVKYVKPKPKPFVDYIKDDGIKKIRIFMNPLVWNPQENQQLVLFEVDSIFYEEFFTDCKTKIGLLKAIIERGDELSKNQIRLESLSKRKWNSKTKEYKLQNSAMLTIYGCPLKWKQKKNKQRVLFKVNGMYHEEEFVNCGSLEGLLEAVMARSESLGRQQSKWKERTLELLAAWSLSFSNNFESLEKVLNENDDRKYDPNEDDFEQPNESLTDTRENAKIYPPPTKNVFATMRKWWKGAFGKKSVQHRESEPTLSQAGRAGSSVVSSSEFNTENDSPISTTESAENELNTFQNLCAVANENNHPFSQDVPKRPNRTTFGNLFKKK